MRRSGWRASASLAEGWAAVRDGGTLFATMVAVIAVVIATATVTDVLTAQRVLNSERAHLAAGGDLLVATSADDGGIAAAACAALAGTAGVSTAFAVDIQPAGAGLAGRPEVGQTIVTATDGVLDLYGIDHLGADEVLVAQRIADRWEWDTGAHLLLTPSSHADTPVPDRSLTVAAAIDAELLAEGASTGILALRPAAGTAEHCYVQADAAAMDDLAAALPGVLGETDDPVQVAWRLPAGAAATNPAEAYEQRTTRWAPAAAGVVGGFLLTIVGWTRRGRAALYASIGVPCAGGVVIRWVEALIPAVGGAVWGALLSVTAASALGAEPALTGSLTFRGTLTAFAISAVVVILTGLLRPPVLAALKDRQ